MKKHRGIISVFLSMLLTAVLIIPAALPVSAANKRFITELRVAAGEDAVAALEEDGWSVTMVGLNITTDPASQVYLAYKLNTGAPLTNVIVSPDVGGDLDDSSDTYTLICYERTADPAQAVTCITAVSADTVAALEKGQIVDDQVSQSEQVIAAAVSISGLEYVRISSKPVSAKEPYYIYRTKDANAGNPISMLYVETTEETQKFLFGTWANEYFFSKGMTTAYSYSMNEDIYNTIWEDQTVCTKLPVKLLNSFSGDNTASKAETSFVEPPAYVSDTEESVESRMASQVELKESRTTSQEESKESSAKSEAASEENAAASEEPSEEPLRESGDTVRYINLTMLTPRDGLPETAVSLTGMRGDPFNPYIERTERSDRTNKFQASVFASPNIITPVLGGVVLLTALGVWFFKRRSVKKALAAAEQTNNPKRSKKTKKTKKSRKSR